jgi:hypothetical protein
VRRQFAFPTLLEALDTLNPLPAAPPVSDDACFAVFVRVPALSLVSLRCLQRVVRAHSPLLFGKVLRGRLRLQQALWLWMPYGPSSHASDLKPGFQCLRAIVWSIQAHWKPITECSTGDFVCIEVDLQLAPGGGLLLPRQLKLLPHGRARWRHLRRGTELLERLVLLPAGVPRSPAALGLSPSIAHLPCLVRLSSRVQLLRRGQYLHLHWRTSRVSVVLEDIPWLVRNAGQALLPQYQAMIGPPTEAAAAALAADDLRPMPAGYERILPAEGVPPGGQALLLLCPLQRLDLGQNACVAEDASAGCLRRPSPVGPGWLWLSLEGKVIAMCKIANPLA